MTATIPVYPGDLAYVEDVVNRYCNGRIPESSVSYHLRRVNSGQMPPEYQAAWDDAVNAYRAWECAEVGDVDYSSLEPELAHPVVYAEACRVALDDQLAALVRVCKAGHRRPRMEVAA